jgi:hypothetical protein
MQHDVVPIRLDTVDGLHRASVSRNRVGLTGFNM